MSQPTNAYRAPATSISWMDKRAKNGECEPKTHNVAPWSVVVTTKHGARYTVFKFRIVDATPHEWQRPTPTSRLSKKWILYPKNYTFRTN
jgi:hypothetical protein